MKINIRTRECKQTESAAQNHFKWTYCILGKSEEVRLIFIYRDDVIVGHKPRSYCKIQGMYRVYLTKANSRKAIGSQL